MNQFEPILQKDGSWIVRGLHIPVCNSITALLYAFKKHDSAAVREHCFWRIADALWNEDQETPLFEKHPWAEDMIRTLVQERYVAFGGAASCGKSHVMAGWGIINWLAAPAETMVLFTSTTLTAARQRVWGCVVKLLDAIDGAPIKIRDSIGSAAYMTESGTIVETAGLTLVAAEKSQTRDAVGKLIGRRNKYLFLIADELSELSPAIIEAAMGNMAANQNFSMAAASNPNSRFDAFGEWAEPKDGWDSINPDHDYSWRTKWGGKYVRFDAMRSPNIMAGENIFPYLPTLERMEEAKASLGENSRTYMRMYRAIFFDSDEVEGIYGESEMQRSGAMQTVELRNSKRLAAIDPSFTNGGDLTILRIGELGYDPTGQYVLQFVSETPLFDDSTNKSVPRTHQIARQIKDICIKNNIDPYDVAIDATGAGAPFCDVVAAEWSPDFLRVNFSGAPSDKPVSVSNRQSAKDLYYNRMSELWFAGKELMRCRQLRGVSLDTAKEMCARQYEATKGSGNLKLRVEPKVEYKKRNGFSPDKADSAFVMIELARARLGLVAVEPVSDDDGLAALRVHRTFRQLDVISNSRHAHLLE